MDTILGMVSGLEEIQKGLDALKSIVEQLAEKQEEQGRELMALKSNNVSSKKRKLSDVNNIWLQAYVEDGLKIIASRTQRRHFQLYTLDNELKDSHVEVRVLLNRKCKVFGVYAVDWDGNGDEKEQLLDLELQFANEHGLAAAQVKEFGMFYAVKAAILSKGTRQEQLFCLSGIGVR